jgi:hypothetical protein
VDFSQRGELVVMEVCLFLWDEGDQIYLYAGRRCIHPRALGGPRGALREAIDRVTHRGLRCVHPAAIRVPRGVIVSYVMGAID